jgi:hypothetical protein
MSAPVSVYRLRKCGRQWLSKVNRVLEDTMSITTLRAGGRSPGDSRLSRREVLAVSGVLAGLAVYLTTLMLVVV